MLDLEPELLTVLALATDGRLSSFTGKPMLSSLLPVPGRKPGDGWAMSSLESLKKVLQPLLAMLAPLGAVDQGATCELALDAVGGFRDMDGTRPPDVSSTASCFRWSPKTFVVGPSQLVFGFRGRCEGSFGGGTGGTVPGDTSDSLSTLHDRVSRRSFALAVPRWCTSGSETWRVTWPGHCARPFVSLRLTARDTGSAVGSSSSSSSDSDSGKKPVGRHVEALRHERRWRV
jgi:hypothetical protein